MATKINIAGAVSNLENILKAVEALTPIAASLGVPAVVANVATMAIAATGVIHNILERKEELKEALTTQDEAKLRSMLSTLQATNDKLAGVISDEAEAAAEEPQGEPQGGTGDNKS
jgi:hypothetical protein